jgi:hypothetical protein
MAVFFAQNTVGGVFASDEFADGSFRVFVRFRYGIVEVRGIASALVDHFGALAEIWTDDRTSRVGQTMGKRDAVGINRHT